MCSVASERRPCLAQGNNSRASYFPPHDCSISSKPWDPVKGECSWQVARVPGACVYSLSVLRPQCPPPRCLPATSRLLAGTASFTHRGLWSLALLKEAGCMVGVLRIYSTYHLPFNSRWNHTGQGWSTWGGFGPLCEPGIKRFHGFNLGWGC